MTPYVFFPDKEEHHLVCCPICYWENGEYIPINGTMEALTCTNHGTKSWKEWEEEGFRQYGIHGRIGSEI